MPVVNADDVPITTIMTRATVTSRPDATVESLIALMTEYHVGCIPIVDDHDRPTGIVTKLDLIECRGDARATAREVMMPHAMIIPADATVARAASLMSTEGIHHLLVVDKHNTLQGVVSTFDITRWVAQQ
jgi:IMP dehydrogenase